MYHNYNKIVFNPEEETFVKPIETKEDTIAKVNCKKLNVRSKPYKESEVLLILNFGEELVIEETKAEWTKVYTSSGVSGYVMTCHIKV